MMSPTEVVALWHDVLRLSKVTAEESVIILTKPEANPRHVDGALGALEQIGAKAFVMMPRLNQTLLRDNRVAMEALKGADFIVDLLGLHILHAPGKSLAPNEKVEIIQANTRILYAVEQPEILKRLMPTPDDKRRVTAAGAKMQAAKRMRVTSPAGTDFECALGDFAVAPQYGFSDEPGHWDHWGGSFVAVESNERSANGTIVLNRGDIIYPFNTYVQSPIRLELRDGYIRDIKGEFDADYLRSYFAKYNDPEAYAASHLGWGLSPKADWTALGVLKSATNGNDGRAFQGNFMFSTGPNVNSGGTRDTYCHLDMPMLNCSVYLDNEPMVIEGKVVSADQRG